MTLTAINQRFRAALFHLGISAVVAAVASLLVFLVWYPAPFSSLAGGIKLFLILVSVDVVMGPALTLVAASPGKAKGELARDLAVIVALQLAAFAYGMYTMAQARPVGLIYEVDRFRVVAAVDLDPTSLVQAPHEFRTLSWTGPRTFSVIKPTDGAELMESVQLGLAGVPLAALPKFWRSYASQSAEAWRRAQPVDLLLKRYPGAAPTLAKLGSNASVAPSAMRFLPVQARHATAVAIVAAEDARIIGFLPVDGDF
jgi:hypothetical protein